MKPEQFLAKLPERGLRLGLSDAGKLAVYGERQAITDRIEQYIRQNKERLLALVEAENITAQNERELSDNVPADEQEQSGYRCYTCSSQLEDREGAFFVDESLGEVVCAGCWQAHTNASEQHVSALASVLPGCVVRMAPAGIRPNDYIERWYARGDDQQPASETETPQERYWRGVREHLTRTGYYEHVAEQDKLTAERVRRYREMWQTTP